MATTTRAAVRAVAIAASAAATAVGGGSFQIHRRYVSQGMLTRAARALSGGSYMTGPSLNLVPMPSPTRSLCHVDGTRQIHVGSVKANLEASFNQGTFRPEIRVLNLLLRQSSEQERMTTMNENSKFLYPDSYFFELLAKMTSDTEKQTNNRRRMQVLVQLRIINRETKEFSQALQAAKDGEQKVVKDDDAL